LIGALNETSGFFDLLLKNSIKNAIAGKISSGIIGMLPGSENSLSKPV
jgi:hypothetical protein